MDIIRKAEADYYASIIKNHSDNSRQLWKTFGNILKKTKTKHSIINKLTLNNKSITDTQNITTEFNDFFCTIGEKLASKFENNGNNEFKKYLNKHSQQSVFLTGVTEEEIMLEIKHLSTNKSPGHDEFTAKFLKISAGIIVPVLCQIFNLSMKVGEYPDLLKIAKVLPIFKKGDPSLTSNYRPISVLSCINKIFERLIFNRIYKFLENSISYLSSNTASIRGTQPHML